MVCDPSEFEPCRGNGAESGSNVLNNGTTASSSGSASSTLGQLVFPTNGRWNIESIFEGCRLRVEMTNSKQISTLVLHC